MPETIAACWFLIKLACFITTVSMGVAFGIAVVWQWMKWAPINITVNVYKTSDDE